jgi:energy-coupling factor transport system permease protein
MIRNIPLGVYYPGTSIVHRLQARTKLLLLLWLVIFLLIANHRIWHFTPYVVVLALIIVAIPLAGMRMRDMWRRVWLLLVLAFVGAFFSLFANYENSHPVLQFGPVHPMYSLLHTGMLVMMGMCAVLFGVSLLPAVKLSWQRRWIRALRFWPLLFIMAALVFLLVTNGMPATKVFSIGPLVISNLGVWYVVTPFCSFLVMYLASLLLTMTTMPVALIEGSSLLLAPLRRFKLPVNDFALMLLLALRFVPTLLDETEQLMKAQQARGADMTHGTLGERLQSLIMLFLPLVQGTLRRASELSVALEARGYQGEEPPTLLHETSLHSLDYMAIGLVIALTAASLFV